jgi:hypothetical protein
MKSWHYFLLVIVFVSLYVLSERTDKPTDQALAAQTQTGAKDVVTAPANNQQKAAVATAQAGVRLHAVQRVNGISVLDDLKTVYEIKGQPLDTEQSPDNKQERVLQYEDCTIGMFDQFVRYVSVPASFGEVELDGQRVRTSLEELKQVLGEPHTATEDGWVYRYGQSALKLMRGENSDQLSYIHYFHIGAM